MCVCVLTKYSTNAAAVMVAHAIDSEIEKNKLLVYVTYALRVSVAEQHFKNFM